jgi:hypothetical protein
MIRMLGIVAPESTVHLGKLAAWPGSNGLAGVQLEMTCSALAWEKSIGQGNGQVGTQERETSRTNRAAFDFAG